jgi:hypothetical protein
MGGPTGLPTYAEIPAAIGMSGQERPLKTCLRRALIVQLVALLVFATFGMDRILRNVSHQRLRKRVDLTAYDFDDALYDFDDGVPSDACQTRGQRPAVQMFSSALEAFAAYAPPSVLNASIDFQDWKKFVNRSSSWESFAKRYWDFSPGFTIVDLDDPPHKSNLVAYMRIYKSANDAIRFNLLAALGEKAVTERWQAYELDESRRETHTVGNSFNAFTFVRDPISHYVAGYSENEWRWFNGFENYPSHISSYCETHGCVFHTFPMGSTDRVWACLGDLLLVRC